MARSNKLIQFYITDQCNSQCKTCFIWTKKKNFVELTLDSIMKVVTDNWDADFVIGGGEPMLHSKIDRLLGYLRHEGIKYTLLSNCIEPESLFGLVTAHQVPNLTISFDGINHDYIRGSIGNKDKIEKFLELTRANRFMKTQIKLSYTLSNLNYMTFPQDMDYIKYKLGFDKVYFCLAQQMDLLHSQANVSPLDIDVVANRLHMLYDKDVDLMVRYIRNQQLKPCDSTTSVHTIYNNGDIVLCQSFMSSQVLGNIYRDKFSRVIEEKASKQIKCKYDDKCKLVCQRRYD